MVIYSAAITSVIGSAYTSVSFLKSFSQKISQHENWVIIGFILLSTLMFVTIGKPVSLLILAGALNGFILPITLATMLIAAYRRNIVGDYRHPIGLAVLGAAMVLVMTILSAKVFAEQIASLFA